MGREASSEDESAGTEVVTARSPSDVLRLVVAVVLLLVLLLVQWLFGDTLVTFASDLLRGYQAIPHWIVDVLVIGSRILAVAVLVFGLLLTLRPQRLAHARDRPRRRRARRRAGPAARTASGRGRRRAGRPISPTASDPRPIRDFPTSVGVGVVGAALTAAAPWLSRGWRRWGWVLSARPRAHPLPRLAALLRLAAAGAHRVDRRRRHARPAGRSVTPPDAASIADGTGSATACPWRH